MHRQSPTLDDDVDGAAGVQRRQRRHVHLTYVLSTRFVGGVPQEQRVSLSYLLIILHTHTVTLTMNTGQARSPEITQIESILMPPLCKSYGKKQRFLRCWPAALEKDGMERR